MVFRTFFVCIIFPFFAVGAAVPQVQRGFEQGVKKTVRWTVFSPRLAISIRSHQKIKERRSKERLFLFAVLLFSVQIIYDTINL